MSSEPSLEGVYNFRDVAKTVNSASNTQLVREGLLFRSGRLDAATKADRTLLRKRYGIKTVIDLRTESEHIQRTRANPKGPENRYAAAAEVETETDPLLEQNAEENWNTIRVNFVSRKFQMNLIKQLRWWQLLWFLILMLFQFRTAAIRILGENVLKPQGLVGLSHDSLRFCGAEIKQTLQIMIGPASYPLLIHCTQGKDRTGLIMILTLLVLGVSLDAIKQDYGLSNEGLAPVREKMITEVKEIGMDRDYTLAPKELVEDVQQFLQAEYGGVDEYLDNIGFGEEDRKSLRKVLSRG